MKTFRVQVLENGFEKERVCGLTTEEVTNVIRRFSDSMTETHTRLIKLLAEDFLCFYDGGYEFWFRLEKGANEHDNV